MPVTNVGLQVRELLLLIPMQPHKLINLHLHLIKVLEADIMEILAFIVERGATSRVDDALPELSLIVNYI